MANWADYLSYESKRSHAFLAKELVDYYLPFELCVSDLGTPGVEWSVYVVSEKDP